MWYYYSLQQIHTTGRKTGLATYNREHYAKFTISYDISHTVTLKHLWVHDSPLENIRYVLRHRFLNLALLVRYPLIFRYRQLKLLRASFSWDSRLSETNENTIEVTNMKNWTSKKTRKARKEQNGHEREMEKTSEKRRMKTGKSKKKNRIERKRA